MVNYRAIPLTRVSRLPTIGGKPRVTRQMKIHICVSTGDAEGGVHLRDLGTLVTLIFF